MLGFVAVGEDVAAAVELQSTVVQPTVMRQCHRMGTGMVSAT